jgi:hypothetical protein
MEWVVKVRYGSNLTCKYYYTKCLNHWCTKEYHDIMCCVVLNHWCIIMEE